MELVRTEFCDLYCGDALELLPTFKAASLDCVVTDPPYMIGAISNGVQNAKCGTWADMQNSAHWFAEWYRETKRILKPTGHMATFGNWRSIPTMICALSKCNWSATSCVVWDKQWIGPAYLNAFRPTYELVITAAMPNAEILNRSASDVFRGEKWLAGQCKTWHPAEKPVDFTEYLIENLSPPDGVVADWFMGSGTTAVASVILKRRFIGCETDKRYFDIAVRRIQEAEGKGSLFDAERMKRDSDLFAAMDAG